MPPGLREHLGRNTRGELTTPGVALQGTSDTPLRFGFLLSSGCFSSVSPSSQRPQGTGALSLPNDSPRPWLMCDNYALGELLGLGCDQMK